MLTVNKLSVTSLSAISANIGNVTAGNISGINISGTTITGSTITGTTINGSTINAGPSNAIVINSAGIAVPDGTSVSGYRISMGGAQIWGANNNSMYCSAGFFAYGQIGTDSNVFMQGDLLLGSASRIFWPNPPTTTFQDEPLVYSTGTDQVFRRTDCITASIPAGSDIEVRGGLVVGYS